MPCKKINFFGYFKWFFRFVFIWANIFFKNQNNIRELDPPISLHQFDANSGKIQYVSDPLFICMIMTLSWINRVIANWTWAIPEKIKTRGGGGGGISKGDQGKIMWNSHEESLYLALEFPRDLTQFCGISRGWALLCLEFPGLK